MDKIQSSVSWYQQKIGSYDKQLWEQSVEQKVLKNLHQAPRRVVRPKTELIDVDLVRGSTFTKAKPQVPWTQITITTVSRVVLFPFHYKWWIQQTSFPFMLFLLMLYTMQVVTIIVFCHYVGDQLMQDEQSLSEVAIPCILMVFLGLIHSQTVLTHLKPPVRDSKRDVLRRKRSLSQNLGATSTTETVGASGSVSPEPKVSQSRSSMKGHFGSRPLRERTKERKVRLKATNNKLGVRADNNEMASQDSESAYHTHDSVVDRTSSLDQESSGNVSQAGLRNSLDAKLDITPRVSIHKCDSDNGGLNKFRKTRESQESSPPESSSDEAKHSLHAERNDKSKRNSQSISSENEDEILANNMLTKMNGVTADDSTVAKNGLDQKISFEGASVSQKCENSTSTENVALTSDKVNSVNGESDSSSFLDISLESSSMKEDQNGVSGSKIAANESSSSQSNVVSPPSCLEIGPMSIKRDNHSKLKLERQIQSPLPPSAVHFTSDPVQQREITPMSSREGTPTHTQSDNILHSKRRLRGSSLCEKTDTESDTEEEGSTNIAVRRRKVVLQESVSCDATGSILRHRRQPIRGKKANSTTGVSSSEGETEGQSSEYSRSSRRTMASSEEWGDHLQSDVDSTSESSSCGSEPEISQAENPVQETDDDLAAASYHNLGMTSSNQHAMNILTNRRQSSTSSSAHPPDKVTCIIWERNECKKVELTALDIGWAIIETVDKIPESADYIMIGLTFSMIMALTPFLFVAFHSKDLPSVVSWDILTVVIDWSLRISWKEMLIHVNAAIQRFCLSAIFFFLLSVADRTFKQRLLYAKHFCYLTSSRRARKFDLPHLRLNKVRNIRTWLSLRSYLKKRGPQRSVDVIVSSAFLLTLIMLILMCLQLLREAETYLNFLVNWELVLWCMALGVYLLRFMTLGLRINKKYRNLSVLITEQINLYLQMEQKPHKKEELMVANNVLKLAESLLKELESPFKISGISANPLILNITKVVVLSAFSAVLTELLGFKLKLYKIKLRP